MSRKISSIGLHLIKSFEGCRLTAYNATGTEKYWTIGWGHYGPDVKAGQKITQAEADAMLVKDLAKYEGYVNALDRTFNQNQFDALVSFCYNCGNGNLQKLCAGHSIEQIAANLPLYNKAQGVVLAGLTRRRAAELELFNEEVDDMQKTPAIIGGVKTDAYLIDNQTYVKVADLKAIMHVSFDNATKTVTINK